MTVLSNLYKKSMAGKALISDIEADAYASHYKGYDIVKRVRIYGDQYIYVHTSESYNFTSGILTTNIKVTDINNNLICSESEEQVLNTPEIEGE